jgi:tol-pal system protein YbgF
MKLSKTLCTTALALLALTASTTPAFAAANKEHLQLMAEIRMLQEQNAQLQQLLGNLQDALKTVSTKIDDQSAATRKAMADQSLAVNGIGDNVRVLREKTDETNVRLSTVGQEVEALRQAIASQPAPQTASALTGGGESGAAASGATATPPPASTTPGTVSPQRMYEASYDDYTAGRFDLAIQGFQGFIQAFPRLANAADAQYNIGMSYYQLSKWTDARDAFQKVITDYPQNTDRVSEAFYKLGQTYERLSLVDNAKRSYETLIQKFPNSFSASQARQALDRLNKR